LKILYGVVGDGMGHAIRSSVVLPKLIEWGHEIQIVASGRAHEFLEPRFADVTQIWGMAITMADNKVDVVGTAVDMLKGAASGWPENVRQYMAMTEEFAPDIVITDFETWSALFGNLHNLPVLSVDNIQAVRRLWHPPEILRGRKSEWRLAKSVIKAKIPSAYHYLVTSFFDAEPRKHRTTVVPPILRQQVLDAPISVEDHVLVYQTSMTFADLPEVLKQFGDIPFRIYGLRRDLTEEQTEGNLTFCPFSEDGFVADLASCRGVIASAGFTLIGEALHLHKPMLATPVRGQFEQVMNARYELDDDSGRQMTVKMTLCDSGGKAGVTTRAYDFYRKIVQDGYMGRFHLVKGASEPSAPRAQIRRPDADKKSGAGARGEIPVLFLNPTINKDDLNNRLDVMVPGYGMIHLPGWLISLDKREDMSWLFAEMTSEVRTPNKGWEKIARRNEAWDLFYYCIGACASSLLNVEKLDWGNPPPYAAVWDDNPLVISPDSSGAFQDRSEFDWSAFGRAMG